VSKQSGLDNAKKRQVQRETTQKVWAIIAASGVKRRWVAKHLGISYGYLNQVQYGQSPMTDSLRKKLSTYLGRPESELFVEIEEEAE
jgi:transcriptional regulator with XRE-family HTH domain